MHLVLDFDGTITQLDTTAELVLAAIRRQRRHQSDLLAAWTDAVQAYMQEYHAFKANYTPTRDQRTTPAQEDVYLANLRPIEEASLTRISHSGIFRDLEDTDLYEMGVEVISKDIVAIRSGWGAVFGEAIRRDIPVTILSVNWSRSFIRGVLSCMKGGPSVEGVKVIANDLSEEGEIIGPGGDSECRLMTSQDKLEALRREIPVGEKVVYVGDSVTDLGCLMEVSRGVALASEEGGDGPPLLLTTLRRIGIELVPVGEVESAVREEENGKKVVFWAKEVGELLESGALWI
ncbi:hypothetical protein E4U31_002278 [Claviceps sp. LM219 group G6]|nr:hypothetical protein E4U15_000448 [Claviceps sp. LM218 group G6]KAG6104037.1 hypothetical protein E4U31_002278 [Claviceps sp. LM219 group G6]KAG6113028.1 hypothetical protein E4U14_001860 [Claviceps sp. LM454 group G7]